MDRFLRALPEHVILVLDEAYFEYVRAGDYPDGVAYVKANARERLISLRTFSKAYGLAGLRVGYAVGLAKVIDYLHRVRLAFNVSAIAQAAARAALDDSDHLERTRKNNAVELPRLEGALRALGLEVTPSQANFVLCGLGREARPIYDALQRRGVIVRPMGAYGLPKHLRITVGTPPENSRLIEALTKVLGVL
jgi:histidinol-phosphate aminotransferase